MEDERIIELYFERDEEAIALTQEKYGAYCRCIALNILGNEEDMRQTENDTYLKLWNTIPPKRPSSLKAYAGTVCRTLSINEYNKAETKKRKCQTAVVLEELSECIPDKMSSDIEERLELKDTLSAFIKELDSQKRDIFLKRYFYAMSVSEISSQLGIGKSSVKMTLLRLRKKLKEHLSKEGIYL